MRKILIKIGFIKPKELKTATDIKKIIEPISEDKFCTGKFENSIGQCCFLGHIAKYKKGFTDHLDGYRGVAKYTEEYLKKKHNIYCSVTKINDTDRINGYNDSTPKQRILHLLNDMIKDGY